MEAATAPGRAIGAGIASAGASISRGVLDGLEEAKKLKAQAKMAEGFLGTLKPEERPIALEEFSNLSAQDKVAKMQGFLGAQAYRKGQEDLLAAVGRRQGIAAENAMLPLRQRALEAETAMLPLKQQALEAEIAARRATEENRRATEEKIKSFNQAVSRRLQPVTDGIDLRPAPDINNQEIIRSLAESGLLMNGQEDNLLSALERGQGRPKADISLLGTTRDIPGVPNAKFVFTSPTAGQVAQIPTDAPQEAPEGWAWSTDNRGKQRLVKTATEKPATGMDAMTLQSVAKQQLLLERLNQLKAQGVTYYTLNKDNVPNETPWFDFGRLSVEEDIPKLENIIRNKQLELSATEPGAKKKIIQGESIVPTPLTTLPTGGTNGIARPQTREDAMKLPRGARFVNPSDGRILIKK